MHIFKNTLLTTKATKDSQKNFFSYSDFLLKMFEQIYFKTEPICQISTQNTTPQPRKFLTLFIPQLFFSKVKPFENIRKSKVFWYFKGVQKDTSDMKWAKTKVILSTIVLSISSLWNRSQTDIKLVTKHVIYQKLANCALEKCHLCI